MSDPIQRHSRQSTRLRLYDHTSDGAYFVTLCTHERTELFGEIVGGEMRLNPLGEIVLEEWHRSSEIRKEIRLDAFVVMPNHVHGIVWIQSPSGVGATDRSPLHGPDTERNFVPGPAKKSLGSFVAGFKSAVTKRVNLARGTPGHAVWQRNYHDRVVRVERKLEQTRQ